jgi:hypothetical protein
MYVILSLLCLEDVDDVRTLQLLDKKFHELINCTELGPKSRHGLPLSHKNQSVPRWRPHFGTLVFYESSYVCDFRRAKLFTLGRLVR